MSASQIKFIRQILESNSYREVELTEQHVVAAIQAYNDLKPMQVRLLFRSEGYRMALLALGGILQIIVDETPYHIPVEIRLPKSYPAGQPTVFVKSAAGFRVKGTDHVDQQTGKVNHPYLNEWNEAAGCNVKGLLEQLIKAFSTQLPVVVERIMTDVEEPPMQNGDTMEDASEEKIQLQQNFSTSEFCDLLLDPRTLNWTVELNEATKKYHIVFTLRRSATPAGPVVKACQSTSTKEPPSPVKSKAKKEQEANQSQSTDEDHKRSSGNVASPENLDPLKIQGSKDGGIISQESRYPLRDGKSKLALQQSTTNLNQEGEREIRGTQKHGRKSAVTVKPSTGENCVKLAGAVDKPNKKTKLYAHGGWLPAANKEEVSLLADFGPGPKRKAKRLRPLLRIQRKQKQPIVNSTADDIIDLHVNVEDEEIVESYPVEVVDLTLTK